MITGLEGCVEHCRLMLTRTSAGLGASIFVPETLVFDREGRILINPNEGAVLMLVRQ